MSELLKAQLAGSINPVAFTVSVVPRGWARARLNGSRHYKDAKTARFENAIAAAAMHAMRGRSVFYGAVELTVISIMPIPSSWPKKKQAQALDGDIRPTGKPDFDNLAKAVADALNGIVWLDDSQVVDGRSLKFFGPEPCIQIAVRAAGAQPDNIIPFGRPGGSDGPLLKGSIAGR